MTPTRRALQVTALLLLLIAAGGILLRIPAAGAHRSLTTAEAMFLSISALTTTGLSTITPAWDLSLYGQIVLLLLMQLGAIGVTVLKVAVFRLMGRHVPFGERVALRDALGLVDVTGVLALTRQVVQGVLLVEAVGALLLWYAWAPAYGLLQGAWFAVFHSVSAFSNASIDLFGGGSGAINPFPRDALTVSVLIACGSLGVPVIPELLRYRGQRRLSIHTQVTLAMWVTLTLLGSAILFGCETGGHSVLSTSHPPARAGLALFHSIASRTSGFNLIALDALQPASHLTIMVLMFIGGSSASTAGGITTGTLAVIILAARSHMRGETDIHVSNRAISPDTLYRAMAVLLVSGFVVVSGAGTLMLLYPHLPFHVTLFEAVSAVATCGFSLGLTGRLDEWGMFVTGVMMIYGRLGPLTLVALMTGSTKAPLIRYPEERLLVG